MAIPRKTRSVADRFWEKVEKTATCWLWRAFVNPCGYGKLTIGSHTDGSYKSAVASRISWELHNGSIPDGLCVCHHCDTPACVRPDHLFLGTHADNMKDMARKGRHVDCSTGAKSPRAKLTAGQVAEIRTEYARGILSQEKIGKHFGISQAYISKICRGNHWASREALNGAI